MGNVKSDLNIFICGNTFSDENQNIINNLFPQTNEDIKFNGTKYFFKVRKAKEEIKNINFVIHWKCFILHKKLDSNLSVKLIDFIINLTENRNYLIQNNHNVILYFSDGNEKNIKDVLLEKKGELLKKYVDKKVIVEDKLPFLVVGNNSKRDDTNLLRHINYLPESNLRDNINNIENKLISIDAYYNEKGTLYKDLLQNNYNPLSIKILLIGKAGAGKTTFLNTSFGELVAKSSSSMNAVTSKCTEYLLPYKLKDKKCRGRIMLIDTPGFEDETSVRNVRKLIENYTKNAKDSKDMVHCALYFLKEGDRLNPYENEIFDYLFGQKIEIFFVITRSYFESKTKFYIMEHFKSIKEERIINVNLVKQKYYISKKDNKIGEIPITGIGDVLYNFLSPDIYNEHLYKNIKAPKTIEDKLKILQKVSFLFKEFNSIEDLKKGSHTKGNAIVAASSCITGACGFIPVPFGDIAPVIGIQIGMIIGLAKVYGITQRQYKLKDIILSGGCSLGDAAVNVTVQSVMDVTKQGFKTVIKEVTEEVVDDVAEETVKNVVKAVIKEGGEKGTSQVLKVIPGLGTIIGGLISAGINAAFTASMGKGTMKLFEDKLLGEDNGYSFLINRIKGYLNIFSQIKYYADNEDWEFDEWI